ncbi:MAG: MFS transporter [Bdellovibrionota bacterium]
MTGELPLFSALRHRNFRLYLAGQSVSMIGTWMQSLATGWLTYRLTGSAYWLGIVSFSSQIPMFLLGPVAGVFVDRLRKHRLLLWTQSLFAVQAMALAVLAATGRIRISQLIALNLVNGVVNVIDMPSRQAFVVQMIGDRRDLQNAIALNSSVMNATRLIGPAIAGIMIAAFGEGACFFLNAVSYIAVLIALWQMEIPPEHLRARGGSMLASVSEGFHAAFDSPSIRRILILLSFLSLFGMPYMTLFPALAGKVLGGGSGTLGWITSAAGLGSLTAALGLARLRSTQRLGSVIGISALLFGLGLVGLSFAKSFGMMMACLYFSGFGMFFPMAGGNTVIQTLVEDDKRGRVMSFFTFSLLGIAPLGSLLMGWAANRFGISATLATGGALCVAGTFVFTRKMGLINQALVTQATVAAVVSEAGS